MKLHSQLTETELQELHANTVEMMGGLPERQVFNCECGKQFHSYEGFRTHKSQEHNIGLPSTYEVYHKYINKNHSTTPQNPEYKSGDKVVLLDGHLCIESFINQEKIFTFVRYSSDKVYATIKNELGFANITTTRTIAPYTENKVPQFDYEIPEGSDIPSVYDLFGLTSL